MSQKVILSVINDLVTDQRVHKVAQTLTDNGYEVTLVGRQRKASLALNKRPYRTHRMKLIFESGKLFYLEFNIRLLLFLIFHPADIYTANDLDTLLPNYIIAHLRLKKLIYDTHEYFTEVPELINRPITRWMWGMLESAIFPDLDHVSTVGEHIARIYEKKYHKKLTVIRNVPFRMDIRKKSKERIVLYQGAVNIGRGIELMLGSMCHMKDVKLWVVGDGDILEEMKIRSDNLQLTDRVTFYGAIPFSDLPDVTQQAAIGLCLEENTGLNYRYISPNKFFDYMQSGLPVIVYHELVEIKAIVQELHTGEILYDRNPEHLAKLILHMLDSKSVYLEYQTNSMQAASTYCWENQSDKLLSMYTE